MEKILRQSPQWDYLVKYKVISNFHFARRNEEANRNHEIYRLVLIFGRDLCFSGCVF